MYDRTNGNVPFSGVAGAMFKHRTLDIARAQGWTIDVRVLGTPAINLPFAPNTRVLLLGERCLKLLNQDDNLNKHRGYCFTMLCPATRRSAPAIATYHPVDCYEFSSDDADDDDDDTKDNNPSEAKDTGSTKRGNYFAWALYDFWKLLLRATPGGTLPWPYDLLLAPQRVNIATPMREAAGWLSSLPSGTCLTLDIECRPQDFSLDCIGFDTGDLVRTVPIYRHTNTLACQSYKDLAVFYRALCQTFLRTDIIIAGHNLAFDLCVLAIIYGLPIPRRLYDTMIAMHRDNPFIEKSLSHGISRYLCTPRNHKADICPNVSEDNLRRLCTYNSEDVMRTRQLRNRQTEIFAQNPALAEAVAQGNDLLHATLMMSLTGIPTSADAVKKMSSSHQLRADQYARVCRILADQPDFNPGSHDQVRDLLYTHLKCPVRQLTKTGAAGTGAKALYDMQTVYNNPLIPLIIQHREAKKAATSMEFKPLTLPTIGHLRNQSVDTFPTGGQSA